jgi:hypothetical protein
MGKRYHYTYRVKFPSQRWFYFGLHSTNDLKDGYSGSPRTHKQKWDLYSWEFEILEFHPTREEAKEVENRLIRPFVNDPMCLNEVVNGEPSFAARSRGGKKAGAVRGRLNAESGQCARIAHLGGKAAVESGQLAKACKLPRPGASYPVRATNISTQESYDFRTVTECCQALGLNKHGVTKCAKGKQRTTNGFTIIKL